MSVLLIWLSQHPTSPTGRQEKSCGCVLFTDGNGEREVLLIRNRRAGHVSFPKGHVEAGETERQTAERELFEETGVSQKMTEPFRTTTRYSIGAGVMKEVVYFAAMSERAPLKAQEEEVSEIFWVPVSEAMRRITHDNDRNVLSRAYAFICDKYPIK